MPASQARDDDLPTANHADPNTPPAFFGVDLGRSAVGTFNNFLNICVHGSSPLVGYVFSSSATFESGGSPAFFRWASCWICCCRCWSCCKTAILCCSLGTSAGSSDEYFLGLPPFPARSGDAERIIGTPRYFTKLSLINALRFTVPRRRSIAASSCSSKAIAIRV